MEHLVKRIQPSRDLEDTWIIFNYVKCVKHWTTMGCYIYDSAYYRVITIAVCNMQLKDATAQIVFWKNLNDVMTRHGIPKTKFKGFMANTA